MMFFGLRKLGNICCRPKMFLNKTRNIFCVPDTKFVSATNVARAGKRSNICVGNNVTATTCPRLPGPLASWPVSLISYLRLLHFIILSQKITVFRLFSVLQGKWFWCICTHLKQIERLSKDLHLEFSVESSWDNTWWRRNHLEINWSAHLKKLWRHNPKNLPWNSPTE